MLVFDRLANKLRHIRIECESRSHVDILPNKFLMSSYPTHAPSRITFATRFTPKW